jgi:hypothetical protein
MSMKLRLGSVILMIVLLTGCAVIKGIHEDNLANGSNKPKNSLRGNMQNLSNLPRQSQTRNATDTASKMLSPVVH